MTAHGTILVILAAAVVLPGCVEMHPTRSGYLTDYSSLQPTSRRCRVRVARVEEDALAGVDSFYIESPGWLADDFGQPASNETDRLAVQASLDAALCRELGAIRPVVTNIGPNTALVRSVVTGVQESKPWANLAVSPQVGPLFNGGAAVEIEIIRPDGVQIAALCAAYRGHEWDLVGFFRRPQHAESAMRQAARQISHELSAAHEPPRAPTPGCTNSVSRESAARR